MILANYINVRNNMLMLVRIGVPFARKIKTANTKSVPRVGA